MKDYARNFYNSKQWKETQAAYMSSKHYICERCGNIAKICHHKTYITPENINDPNITLSWSNLEALCQTCHTQEHLSGGICAEGLAFDSKGNLIQTPQANEE